MTERRCPHCNNPVPSNSINCPSCYKAIPRETEVEEKKENVEKSEKSRKLAIFLSIIPGVFGIMGLGQMYLGETRKGVTFLALGLPLMLILAFIMSSVIGLSTGWTILGIGAMILVGIPYVILFLIQVMDVAASSVLRSVFPSFS